MPIDSRAIQDEHAIVLASGNAGKLRELGRALAPLGWTLVPQTELGVESPVEDGLSFIENALIKARHASRVTGRPALADDSGLEVAALDGAPGIQSARFAGEGATDADNNALLLQRLQGIPASGRRARFQAVLVLLRHAEDPVPLVAQGSWDGQIADAPSGGQGFGYDPLFLVDGRGCSAAQLAPEEKACMSHRGQAVADLVRQLRARPGG